MSDERQRTREILKKVRQVEIQTRRLVTDAMAGAYHSSFRGQGIDFEEVREYAPGDDVRSIDWNVTARMDKPFVKVFREERELSLVIAVDLSASGDFASTEQTKRERMAELAAVLAFSALRNSDKVGLLLFTDQVELFIPPRKGRSHILRVIREILFFEPQHKGTNIPAALDAMNRLVKRRAVCFLLSDFLTQRTSTDVDTDAVRAVSLTNSRHDLVCVQINDPREFELPNVGRILLEDAETGEVLTINTGSKRVRKQYAEMASQRAENLKAELARRGIDHLPMRTDEPYLQPLKRFFEKRGARK